MVDELHIVEQARAWMAEILEGRQDPGDFPVTGLESLAERYLDRVETAWAKRGQDLVRIYCDKDRPRRAWGRVLETPFGLLLQIQTTATEFKLKLGHRQYVANELVLLAEPPGPWWAPSLRCVLHGDGPVSLDELVHLAAKASDGAPIGRVLVRCQRRTHSV